MHVHVECEWLVLSHGLFLGLECCCLGCFCWQKTASAYTGSTESLKIRDSLCFTSSCRNAIFGMKISMAWLIKKHTDSDTALFFDLIFSIYKAGKSCDQPKTKRYQKYCKLLLL